MAEGPAILSGRKWALRFRWTALLLTACAGSSSPPVAVSPPNPLERSGLPESSVIVEKWPMPRPRIPTRRDQTVDRFHGVDVPDPYRWLENGDSPEVSAWVDAQNQLLERKLSASKARPLLRARLAELLQIGWISLPTVRKTQTGGLRLFFKRREGKQEQPILVVRDGSRGTDSVLLDPNVQSTDGTLSLDWYEPSEDGALVAYGTSQGGSEDSILRVRNVQTGQDLSDTIGHTRHASVAWTQDGKRFFYSRYPEPGSVPKGEERYHRRIYEHRLGRDPKLDPLVFGDALLHTDYPSCQTSPDGRWLVISVSRGWNESEIHLADLEEAALTFHRLTPPGQNRYAAIARRDALFVLTNEGASRYRLFQIDPKKPDRTHWRLLIAEHPTDVLANVELVGTNFLVSYQQGGISRLERFDIHGKSRGPIPLPTLGTSDGFSGLSDGSEAFYNFESFAVPPTIHRLDLTSSTSELWESISAPLVPEDYRVEERQARSPDGTQIPYRLVQHRSVNLSSGNNPTLLYGYGGFNEKMQPRFSRANFAWLEQGGIYVQAVLRGGGEFGEDWHRAGQRAEKQNTFDDFIAVAEDLIQGKVTNPRQLAIHGRSNGGLLVAAALTQRPELFQAAVAGVPLTDMVRYPEFLIAKLWIPEYGSPRDPDEFRTLFAYSPYHRVRPGVSYPAVLVTTAESDTRVDPLHARKFVAALQQATRSDRPILLRTERKAGHGAGTPVSKLVLEFADLYAFLLEELGMLASGS